VDRMYHTYIPAEHLAGFAELPVTQLDSDPVQPGLVEAGTEYLRGPVVVNVIRQSPRKLLVSYVASSEGRAPIGLLYFPLWRIKQTSESLDSPILSSSAEGLVEVPVVPGHHELELVFDTGGPERYGIIVTILSLIVVGGGSLFQIALRVIKKPKTEPLRVIGFGNP